MIDLQGLKTIRNTSEEEKPLILEQRDAQIPTIAENAMYRGEAPECPRHLENCCILVQNSSPSICATACLVGNVTCCILMPPYERALAAFVCLSSTIASLYGNRR